MTDQTPPTGKVAQLTPEEWKQLVLLNTAQLQNYLQQIPGNTETGVAGVGADHLALVDGHLNRLRTFLRAWSVARLTVSQEVAQPMDAPAAPNAEPKRKGGWPKGRARKAPAAQGEPQS